MTAITPIGLIRMTTSTIPSGWAICDGTNGTPDLTDYFIRGAAIDSDLGVSGGASTHTHTLNANISGGGHAHSISVSGGHSGSTGTSRTSNTITLGGGHYHTFSGSSSSVGGHQHTCGTSGATSSLPPYFKMAFMMKVS